MANPEHVKLVKQGAAAIQAWQKKKPDTRLDLREANLRRANLRGANLREANLSRADLSRADLRADLSRATLSAADLSGANLSGANLSWALLSRANLNKANLSEADLSGADLSWANLFEANLFEANLSGAGLGGANLSRADLIGANVEGASLGSTTFADVDLSAVRGLESVTHLGPSEIGIHTIYKSHGKIPESFLRGCGVPDALIAMIPSLIGAMEPIQYQSCFISYSTKDDEFARRLHSRMRDEKLRVWFAEKDLRRGDKLHEQIDEAIHVHDRLLVVLSRHSMKSDWVKAEIIKARKTEREENRRKLFPIALVPFIEIQKWQCFDPHTDEDLAAEIRQYFLPDDFSNWKDHDAFESAFAALLRDLRAQA